MVKLLAFCSPDSVAGARPELLQPSGAPHSATLATVAELIPRAERFLFEGTLVPLILPLLAAPHPPGLFNWQIYINVVTPAPAGMDATLSFGDAQGAQTLVQGTFGLAGAGIVAMPTPVLPFYSAGVLPISVALLFGGAVGPPLAVDIVTSIALVG